MDKVIITKLLYTLHREYEDLFEYLQVKMYKEYEINLNKLK